jgi:FkbM family methyltransferase
MNLINKILKKAHTALFKESGRSKVAKVLRLAKLNFFSDFNKNIPVVYRLKNGDKFIVHPKDYLSQEIYLRGEYEELESRVVKSLIFANEIAIDVGANIGYYTAFLSKAVGLQGQVCSFEPGKNTFCKLQQTVKYLELKNVDVFQLAIGDQDNTIDFFESTSGHDAQQSVNKWEGMKLVDGDYTQNTVEIKSLDSFLGERNFRLEKISFIKCDVEGFEEFVLKGSTLLLNSLNPPIWQIEINKIALAANKSEIKDIIDRLLGYVFYYTPLAFSPGTGKEEKLKKIPLDLQNLPQISNLFAFPLRGTYSGRIEELYKKNLLVNKDNQLTK